MIAASSRRLVLTASTLVFLSMPALAKEQIVAYVPNWVDLKSFAETIDYTKVTHINVAFENPVNDSGELSFHPQDEFLIAKAHANHVKILVSIGGGSTGSNKTLQAHYFTSCPSPAPRVRGKARVLCHRSRFRRPGRRHRRRCDQPGLRGVRSRAFLRPQAERQIADRGVVARLRWQERPRFGVRALRFHQRDGL